MRLASQASPGSEKFRPAPLEALDVAQAAAPSPEARWLGIAPARDLRGAARCASHVAGRQLCIARRRAGRSGGRHR
jgi:hypothetical protein